MALKQENYKKNISKVNPLRSTIKCGEWDFNFYLTWVLLSANTTKMPIRSSLVYLYKCGLKINQIIKKSTNQNKLLCIS